MKVGAGEMAETGRGNWSLRLDMYLPCSPFMEFRPIWFRLKPSERVKRLISRISIGTVIHRGQLEALCDRLVRRISPGASAVRRAVISNRLEWVCNGRWFYSGEFCTSKATLRVAGATPVAECLWCRTPLFPPKHKKSHRHCGSRACREIDAAFIGKHLQIRPRVNHALGMEVAKAKLLAAFFTTKFTQKRRLQHDNEGG